jgi:hypothetical protein
MKVSEFRKLIREEVRKVLKENMIAQKSVSPKALKLPADTEDEYMLDTVKSKYKTKLVKKVPNNTSETPVEIYQVEGTPYIVVDEDGMGTIFKAVDMTAVVAAIKDGSYFEFEG